MHKVKIEKLSEPVGVNYNYNAKIFTSVDNGKTFHYCGNGKYFQTLEEAEKYKKEVENNWIQEGAFPSFFIAVYEYMNNYSYV